MEKVSRRINELETIHTNVKLLKDMLEQYGSQTTESEKEMMKVTFVFGYISKEKSCVLHVGLVLECLSSK